MADEHQDQAPIGPTGAAAPPVPPLGPNGPTGPDLRQHHRLVPSSTGPTGYAPQPWREPQPYRRPATAFESQGTSDAPPPLPLSEQISIASGHAGSIRPASQIVELKIPTEPFIAGAVEFGPGGATDAPSPDIVYSPTVQLQAAAVVEVAAAVDEVDATLRSPISRNLSLQPEDVASQARLFVEAIRSQIAAMPPTPNEPNKLEFHNGLIEFLERLAAGLSELAETLDKMVANRGNSNEPILLGKAAIIADHLGIGAMDFITKNREKLAGMMILGGFYGAATLLAMSLGIDKEFLEAMAKIFGKGSK